MDAWYGLAVFLTHTGDGWRHGGWMWLWGPLMMALWIGLIVSVVWLFRRGGARERTGVDRARDILAERYAGGEISTEEYRERLDQLQ
jgi:putative membrane protein